MLNREQILEEHDHKFAPRGRAPFLVQKHKEIMLQTSFDKRAKTLAWKTIQQDPAGRVYLIDTPDRPICKLVDIFQTSRGSNLEVSSIFDIYLNYSSFIFLCTSLHFEVRSVRTEDRLSLEPYELPSTSRRSDSEGGRDSGVR